jgi:hypothetical protein
VRRPKTTLDCTLIEDIGVVFAAVQGPEINLRVKDSSGSEQEFQSLCSMTQKLDDTSGWPT